VYFLFLSHVFLGNQTKGYSFVGAGMSLCIYGIEIIGFGKWVAINKSMGYLVMGSHK
jgi:hypothetical protein